MNKFLLIAMVLGISTSFAGEYDHELPVNNGERNLITVNNCNEPDEFTNVSVRENNIVTANCEPKICLVGAPVHAPDYVWLRKMGVGIRIKEGSKVYFLKDFRATKDEIRAELARLKSDKVCRSIQWE